MNSEPKAKTANAPTPAPARSGGTTLQAVTPPRPAAVAMEGAGTRVRAAPTGPVVETDRRKTKTQFAYDLLGDMLSRRREGQSVDYVESRVSVSKSDVKLYCEGQNTTALLRVANGDVHITQIGNSETLPKTLNITRPIVSIVLLEDGLPFAVSCPKIEIASEQVVQ